MPRDKRAHRTLGDIFGRLCRADFTSWAALRTGPLLGWLAFVALCSGITFLMTFQVGQFPSGISAGMVAQRDIRADRDYEIIDKDATNKFKSEAVSSVLNVYDYDPDLGKKVAERVSSAFDETRKRIAETTSGGDFKDVWEDMAGVSLTDAEWQEMKDENFSGQLESAITSQVVAAMKQPVVADREAFIGEKGRGVILKQPSGEETVLSAKEIAFAVSLDEIRKKTEEGRFLHGPFKKNIDLVAGIAGSLIQPNVMPNYGETETRHRFVAQAVNNVIIKIDSGEMIIRAGSRYEPRHVMVLEGILHEKEKTSTPLEVVGKFAIILLTILCTYYFAERYIRKFAPEKVDLYFMGTVLFLIVIILRISLATGNALQDSIAINIPRTAFHYAVPIAGAAMLVRFILNSETALVFSVMVSIIAGIFVKNDLNFTSYCLLSSVVAAASIAYADKRSVIIRAGLYTALINSLAAMAIHLVNASSITAESLTLLNIMWDVVFAVVGGLSCAAFVMVITPIVEGLFGYTTDIKLLELANLNHPLLRELVIRAPGTYHHSHLVGILAESAAEAIGANPLLTRVAAYYHDIGKIRKPMYFVENMREGESRHDKLSSHMSALIIATHVKDGVELAREYKVPKRIVDAIEQHHGTKMISFFYDKALTEADPSLQKLEEKDFRYQGPKPQTREAGILLLADVAEAAVRALKEKSPARIQQTVEDVINSSFTEAQLDECDLTLRNLNDIAKAFTKILMGIYHQRIEYPRETLQDGDEGTVKDGRE